MCHKCLAGYFELAALLKKVYTSAKVNDIVPANIRLNMHLFMCKCQTYVYILKTSNGVWLGVLQRA